MLARDGAIRDEEVEYRRKDGSTFWGLVSATGLLDQQTGRLLCYDAAIHDITGRKEAEQRQAAQYAVAQALADSSSLAEAAPQILAAVCRSLRWDLGTLWEIDSKQRVLRCVDLWHEPGLDLAAFERETHDAAFKTGTGLPGRIWQSREPAWISDALTDRNFPRAQTAAACGLHGAFGFPISLGQEVLGVIEFFSRQIRQPDAHLLAMFSAIGSQIGQFIERKRREAEVQRLNKDLEKRVKERTAELSAANAALKESEGRYRTVAEHTPAAIVVMDTQAGLFIEANENAVRLFGMPRDKLLKAGPVELSPEFQPDGKSSTVSAGDKIRKALQGSTPVFEWMHCRADGTNIPCEVRVARMPATGRELVIGAITDISARKKAEAELLSALEQEKELSRLKSNFVNVVSHEFRTPLGVIMSAADILESYFERLRAEQRAEHLQDIRQAAMQMAKLMEEVLLLGRVESGRMECHPEAFDLPDFCRRLVDEQKSASGNRCPIRLELKLPSKQADGDQAVLRHIFNNLLSNAIKYSSPGKAVRFSVHKEDEEAIFEIQDHGIGIPPDDQKSLFEAFHRGSNVGEIPGTGLGMVIVKRCLDLHSGQIACESRVGQGTTFVVRLKLFGDAAPKPRRAAQRKMKVTAKAKAKAKERS